MASTAASDRATPLRGTRAESTPVEAIARTIARKTRASPAASCRLTSHLDLDHSAQPERTHSQEEDGKHHHHDAEWRRPQGTQIRGVGEHEVQEEHDGQATQDPAREPAFGGEHLDLTTQALALAQSVRDRGEELGEVTADIALYAHGH